MLTFLTHHVDSSVETLHLFTLKRGRRRSCAHINSEAAAAGA